VLKINLSNLKYPYNDLSQFRDSAAANINLNSENSFLYLGAKLNEAEAKFVSQRDSMIIITYGAIKKP
jgi:hypothetical protein